MLTGIVLSVMLMLILLLLREYRFHNNIHPIRNRSYSIGQSANRPLPELHEVDASLRRTNVHLWNTLAQSKLSLLL